MNKLIFLVIFSLAIWHVNSLNQGTNVTPGLFPSFVMVFVPAPVTACGGVILNQNHVLTLASCVLNANFAIQPLAQVSVLAGHVNFNQTAPRLQTSAIYINPRYNPFTFDSDLAVIRTATNFNFPTVGNPTIAPGVLNEEIAFDSQPCNVAALNRNTNTVQTIAPPILNRDLCNDLALNLGRITEGMICAGQTTAGPGVCNHNMGGILYCNGIVTGILNSGYGCGQANNPGVYIQTRFFNDWIRQQFTRSDTVERFP